MKNKSKPFTLVITPGDPEGIGPEVTAKALFQLHRKLRHFEVKIFGSSSPFRKYKKLIKNIPLQFSEPPQDSTPGHQSGWAIEVATRFILASPKTRALITGPIHKGRLQEGGYPYRGHTDFIAALTTTQNASMILTNQNFVVILVTDHCSLKEVPKNITPEKLMTSFKNAVIFSKNFLRKNNPKIAVLGLNPHAGEEGILGDEEKRIIIPAMNLFSSQNPGARLEGPYSSDSFFATEMKRAKKERHDVIVAMYHDQGLIPIKLSGFSKSLNLTLGLPFLRTSVDHGTAFDIAGKNKADPGSMIYALEYAMEYFSKKR